MITFWSADKRWDIAEIGMYSDDTPFVKTKDFYDIAAEATGVTIKVKTIPSFFAGLALAKSVHATGSNPLTLVLPYIPGARQDRVNPTGDVLSSLALVADMINAVHFARVIVADPHSEAAGKMIENMVSYPLTHIYEHLWKGYTGVIVPDKGAHNRGLVAHSVLGEDRELKYGSKVRDVSNGRLTGFDVEPLTKGGHYIIVDDICDGGGTFIGLAEKIAEQGAYADLFVTHGIFSKGVLLLHKHFQSIYTTDTRNFHDRGHVNLFNIVSDMENY